MKNKTSKSMVKFLGICFLAVLASGLFLFISTAKAMVIIPYSSLGDVVWEDLNANGIQDDGEPGVKDVPVELYDCGPDGTPGTPDDDFIGSTTTDTDGFYLFEDLVPGSYYIKFMPDPAGGYVFTLKDQGSDGAKDSDADQVTGIADCTQLEAGEVDLTWDAGLIQPVCDIDVQVLCLVEPPPQQGFGDCSDAKPIDSLTMVWSGVTGIAQIAVYSDKYEPGDPDKNLMYTIQGPIETHTEVTADRKSR